MNIVDKAIETQLTNIQTKTGKTLKQLYSLISKSGLSKHGEIRDMLKRDLALGHGDANTLTLFYTKSLTVNATPAEAAPVDVLSDIYNGAKEPLRPIHEKFMAAIQTFGTFEISPKKGYVSLRRKKQFAMIGPGTKSRVEVGINMKGVKPTTRLIEQPAGGMCQYKVFLTAVSEVDKELIAWVKQAYDSAG